MTRFKKYLNYQRLKKFLTLFFVLYQTVFATAQNNHFSWVKQLTANPSMVTEYNYFIGTDSLRNVYVAGNFINTIDADPGAANFTLSSATDNIFITKLTAAGNFVWSKQLGSGAGFAYCRSLKVDQAGNVYTTGYFQGILDFDPGAANYFLDAPVNPSPDNNDIFILKLSADGDFIWAKQIGGSHKDVGTCIDLDPVANIYVTGYITGPVDLDPGAGVTLKGSNGVVTAFITKFSAAGDLLYANEFQSNQRSSGEFIRTDHEGNVFVSGHVNGSIDFDPGLNVVSYTTTINSQVKFVVKFDPLGNFMWVRQGIIGYDIAVDGNGDLFVYDEQLTKYDHDGNLMWTKLVGGGPYSSFEQTVIAIDENNDVYITGMFRNTQDFDPGPGEVKITCTGAGFPSDVFVCKLTNDGDLVWVKTFGGPGEDYASGIAVTQTGEIYTIGEFEGTADFDPDSAVFRATADAKGSLFIHKLSSCTKIDTVLTVTTCKRYTLNNVSYDSSGTYYQTLSNNYGCDSTITLALTITTSKSSEAVVACKNYVWHSRQLLQSGIYADTLLTTNGCDSITLLDLTITDKLKLLLQQ